MKSVRFRVEFSPILGYTNAHSQAATSSGSGGNNAPVGGGSGPSSSDSGSNANPGGGSRPPSMTARGASYTAKSAAPYTSTLVLVQEKGALSTFRHLYTRLRAEWSGRAALESPDLSAGAATPLVGTPKTR